MGAAIAQLQAGLIRGGRGARIKPEGNRGAIERASYIGARSGHHREKGVPWRGRHATETSFSKLGDGGNGHRLSHEFLKRGQARLDGIFQRITAGERVGRLEAVAGDAEHGLFVGTYAALRD